MIAYKVVGNLSEGRYSSVLSSGTFRLTYQLDMVTEAPPPSQLFVYRLMPTRADIARLIGDFRGCSIFRVEIGEFNPIFAIPFLSDSDKWLEFWHGPQARAGKREGWYCRPNYNTDIGTTPWCRLLDNVTDDYCREHDGRDRSRAHAP